MHNIRTNFRKFYGICKVLFEKEVDTRNNFQFYPVSPKMNDLEVVAQSVSKPNRPQPIQPEKKEVIFIHYKSEGAGFQKDSLLYLSGAE
jgi:hypothetical protein